MSNTKLGWAFPRTDRHIIRTQERTIKKTAETSRRSGLLCSRGYLDYVCVHCSHLREFKCRYSIIKQTPLGCWRCEQLLKDNDPNSHSIKDRSSKKISFLNHSLLPSQTFTSPIPILHKWFIVEFQGLVSSLLTSFSSNALRKEHSSQHSASPVQGWWHITRMKSN